VDFDLSLKALLRYIDRLARFNEAKDWRQAASAVARMDRT
jgi:hypothetical protein